MICYRKLDVKSTVATISRLQQRIDERFPESGLSKVCHELHTVAVESSTNIARIAKPNYWLRAVVGVIIAIMVFGLIVSLLLVDYQVNVALSSIVTVLESIINDLILIGAAIFFLVSIETRIDRHLVLTDLHELRAIAHVIDMHQLTKNPTRRKKYNTKHSPTSEMEPYELARYLDYCSEMLALTGKVAALYSQASTDSVIVAAINEVEQLTTGLSRKVWQKLMVLDRVTAE